METSFAMFDDVGAQNMLWTDDLSNLNQRLAEAHDEDAIARPGVTLVVGCPLPEDIQRKILAMQREFNEALVRHHASTCVKWRSDLAALHMTVYGLVKPPDYHRRHSWPLSQHMLNALRHLILPHLGVRLTLQGLGLLGRGSVAVRIADCNAINTIRSGIEEVHGISGRSRGEGFNQMVLGRLLPSLIETDRHAVRAALHDVRDFFLGEVQVDGLELVHYKHEFLTHIYEQHMFPSAIPAECLIVSDVHSSGTVFWPFGHPLCATAGLPATTSSKIARS